MREERKLQKKKKENQENQENQRRRKSKGRHQCRLSIVFNKKLGLGVIRFYEHVRE